MFRARGNEDCLLFFATDVSVEQEKKGRRIDRFISDDFGTEDWMAQDEEEDGQLQTKNVQEDLFIDQIESIRAKKETMD